CQQYSGYPLITF
nr:immunoglobulin light chain junction region [Mus musculus]NSL97307.1 immunoglobulin light chain junction region [Mus musculus]NSL97921.1 immunoglobulin light chain junction region [Mus musculus]NSL98185.1 immunoglobulin light chain junction region [Mus musculus]NSL98193.1 immunoglobulin light chain junction region [Mus musculus]